MTTADRRTFLSMASVGVLAVGCGATLGDGAPGAEVDEVTAVEDLMREHGVLRRVMYLYDEARERLAAGRELPLEALAACAGMIRRVIEDYHEKLEEDFLFPRFERAGKLAALTTILRAQHAAGRTATARILELTSAPLDDRSRTALGDVLHAFNHMYRPHAAREDTVLFPALRGVIGAQSYATLGDQFEALETKMLGPQGFERAVTEVSQLERAFGVDDLGALTI